MIQVRRWIPMHADLARSMPLRFPVQSCSMCAFRAFRAKLQVACFPDFSCKAAGRVLSGLFMQSRRSRAFRIFHAKPRFAYFPGLLLPARMRLPGECGFRGVRLPGECACAGTLQTRAFFLCLYVRICPVTGALP